MDAEDFVLNLLVEWKIIRFSYNFFFIPNRSSEKGNNRMHIHPMEFKPYYWIFPNVVTCVWQWYVFNDFFFSFFFQIIVVVVVVVFRKHNEMESVNRCQRGSILGIVTCSFLNWYFYWRQNGKIFFVVVVVDLNLFWVGWLSIWNKFLLFFYLFLRYFQ